VTGERGETGPAFIRFLRRKETLLAASCAGLLAGAVLSQRSAARLHADSRLKASPFEWSGEAEKSLLQRRRFAMYLPERRSLHFASLGNDSLAADAVWIKTAGYVTREYADREGRSAPGRKFEWLSKLYGTVQELDPLWENGCRVGAMILAAVGGEPSGSVELLERGMRERPDSWRLPFEAGVTCLLWPGHAEDAARYFKMASLRPGCPELVRQIIPKLAAEAGRLEQAIRLARERAVAFGAGHYMGEAARAQLREFVSRLLERELAGAVRRFREATGRSPDGLSELRRMGELVSFDYHFAGARVVFEEKLKELVRLFRSLHPEKAPEGGFDELAREGFTRVLADSGFLHAMVVMEKYPAPEREDAYGRPFLYHAPTGTVRSEGLAEVVAKRTRDALQGASNLFRRRTGRRARSLEELAGYFAERIRRGLPMPQDWTLTFEGGRPPEHPLAAWGDRYVYDPETGEVGLTGRFREEAPTPGPGDRSPGKRRE
jgi:hypothetical protein